ncbi:MAG: hypothetical protein IT325_13560, partial [Anaerolineae bacterium]|nr:hypothetical protein [Anaerolineae bacterium]
MSENNTQAQAQPQVTTSDAALRELGVLVGTWKVSGEAQGQVSYEWLDGGYFLVQHIDLMHDGHPNKGIEIIGRERVFGAEQPSEDIKSRYYG